MARAPSRPLAVVAFATLALQACGSDDVGAPSATSTRAQPAAVALAKTAAGPDAKARSGVVSGEAEIDLKGVPGFSDPFTAGVSGPFEYREGAVLPDYELELGVRDYGVTLTSVDGKSYVSIGSTAYELPGSVRRRLVRTANRGRNGLTRTIEQFGIAPWRWETEQRIAGAERIDGVQTTHITTSFVAGRILSDANTLLGLLRSLGLTRVVGLPSTITPSARRVVVRGVTTKVGASWIGVSDKVLRQSAFTMRFGVAKADRGRLGGLSGGTVKGKLTVTEVGEPQDIEPPAEVGSFADFKLAIDALGDAAAADRTSDAPARGA